MARRPVTILQRIEYAGVRLFLGGLRLFPEGFVTAAGSAIGGALPWLLRRRARTVAKNLELALPELDDAERARIARDYWRAFGRQSLSAARLLHLDADAIRERVRVADGCEPMVEHFDRSMAEGRGVILVTGHIGNWELLAQAAAALGHPIRVVARRLKNPLLDEYVRALRSREGNAVTDRWSVSGLRRLIAQLESGGVVGLLADQHASPAQGVLVPFFGKRAWSYAGPAEIAFRTGSSILPAFLRRDPDAPRRFVIQLGEPILAERQGELDDDVVRVTAAVVGAIETEIRARPAEWLWSHRRWKESHDAPGLYPERIRLSAKRRSTGEHERRRAMRSSG